MTEKELNTSIVKSFFHLGGWAYKIPDSGPMVTRHRPFDGIGVLPSGAIVFWEAKFSKSPRSLPPSRFEDHQLPTLQSLKALSPKSLVLILYGVIVPRKEKRLIIVHPEEVLGYQTKWSQLREKPYLSPLKGGLWDLSSLEELAVKSSPGLAPGPLHTSQEIPKHQN